MKLQSKADLEQYVRQRLGEPVIKVNLAQEQFDQNIDDALQFYLHNHYDGYHDSYFQVTITADDVTNGYITIPDEIFAIVDIIEPLSGTSSDIWMSESWQMSAQTYNSMRSGGNVNITEYVMSKQQINMLNSYFTPVREFSFNKSSNKLRVPGTTLVEGNSFMIHCYTMLNGEVDVDLWNDTWLKGYATALCGISWGEILSKFDGATLPGGVSLNGDGILSEYKELKETLMEEFHTTWSDPVNFFLG